MAKTFSSLKALQQAIEDEARAAFKETIEDSFHDLHEHVDDFYSRPGNPTSVACPPPGYDRTGQLAESPEREITLDAGKYMEGELRLDTTYKYDPAGRDTKTIYGYAEEGGLLGKGGFWIRTEVDIEKNMNNAFKKRFD